MSDTGTRPNICVSYCTSSSGKVELAFAADLHRRLHGSSGKLVILLEQDHDISPADITLAQPDDHADIVQRERVAKTVSAETNLSTEQIEVRRATLGDLTLPTESIFVGEHLAKYCKDFSVLVPYSETGVDERGDGPIIIPFGAYQSGCMAAVTGLPLAKLLGKEVIFWHTTLKKKGLSSSASPEEHMCSDAIAVRQYLEAEASRLGVSFKTVVEHAKTIVDGIIACANRENASLIIMSRGVRTTYGSYVDQVLERSAVPILVGRKCQINQSAHPVRPARSFTRSAPTTSDKSDLPTGIIGKFQAALAQLHPATVAMLVVACIVALKAGLKIWSGTHVNSPMIAGDGYHNLADLVELAAVQVVLLIARRPATHEYQFGRRNVEFFIMIFIGLVLMGVAAQFVVKSAVGILSYFPAIDHTVRSAIHFLPAFEPVSTNPHLFPWLLAVTLGSAVLSFFAGTYQIRVGSAIGSPGLVAAGKEIRSDAKIELVTAAGVIAEHALHMSWLEYPLALIVAAMVIHTGWELSVKGCRVLLQHSLGLDNEIRSLCMTVRGVLKVHGMITFQVGQMALCHIWLTTGRNELANSHIESEIKRRLAIFLQEQEFPESSIEIIFQPETHHWHRKAIAIVRQGVSAMIAKSFAGATDLIICDVERGEVVRTKEQPLPETLAEQLSLLMHKQVTEVFLFGEPSPEVAAELVRHNIAMTQAESYLLTPMGVPTARACLG